KELLAFLAELDLAKDFDAVFLVSALKGDGVEDVELRVLDELPFSRPFYDEQQIT
ncbi:MAG: GTPase Era, partial [Anaerolineae bacterium]|nr:GTPase Era [Anaerolineae bacterium]